VTAPSICLWHQGGIKPRGAACPLDVNEHDRDLASNSRFFTAFCEPWVLSKRRGYLDFGSNPVEQFLCTSVTDHVAVFRMY